MPDTHADLYETPGCPHAKRANQLLQANGYSVDHHVLDNPADAEAYKQEHGVSTLPQVFINGKHIGGASELEQWLDQHATDVGMTKANDLV